MILPSLAVTASPQTSTVFWYVVRGSGFVVFLLLSSAVILGLLLSLHWRTDTWPRVITEELHRYIMLVAAIFLLFHIGSTLLDSFIHFQLYQVFLPFTSTYRPLWLGLGIISMYLGAALYLSIYLRKHIGYRAWRTLHYAGFLAWLSALTHGITSGTDSRAPWALALYAGSALIVSSLLAVRFGGLPVPLGQPPRYRPDVLKWLGAGLATAAVLAAVGPLRPGWAAWAGTPKIQSSPTTITAAFMPATGFQDPVTGTATPSGTLGPGGVLLTMRLTAQGTPTLQVRYGLFLQQDFGGARFLRGVFSLAPANLAWNCSGSAAYRDPNTLLSTCRLPSNRVLQLALSFSMDNSGSVTGRLSATPESAQPAAPPLPGGSDESDGA